MQAYRWEYSTKYGKVWMPARHTNKPYKNTKKTFFGK